MQMTSIGNKGGIIHALLTVKDPEVMQAFIKALDNDGLHYLFTFVEYTNEETKRRWVQAYNDL